MTARRFDMPAMPAARPAVVQAKLRLGAAGDPYEREADQAARRVVDRLAGRRPVRGAPPVEAVPVVGVRQRIRGAHGADLGAPVDPTVQEAIEHSRDGQPLPDRVRGPMERELAADFSGVRLHTDAGADQVNRSLGALAFTAGRDIYFRRGAYDHGSRSGLTLIAHELSHVAQQADRRSPRSAPDTVDTPVQRYLFGETGYFASPDAYKQAIGGSYRGTLVFVKQAIEAYVQNYPRVGGIPKNNSSMSVDELALARQSLEHLMAMVDEVLTGYGFQNLSGAEVEGTEQLRVNLQNELMRVTKFQATRGVFAAPAPAPPANAKTQLGPFKTWMEAHPVWDKWKGQGAGACADATKEIARTLRTDLFTAAEAGSVKVRGILAFPPKPATGHANHFVVVVRLSPTLRAVVDATMGQFLGGKPSIESNNDWRARFRKAKVAFHGYTYLPPVAVRYKDFKTVTAAVKAAPSPTKTDVTLDDVAAWQRVV
jgi:hypothetical protein